MKATCSFSSPGSLNCYQWILRQIISQSVIHWWKFSASKMGYWKRHFPVFSVPPNISLKFMHEGNRTVAVCKAEGGNPAANISWSHVGNSSSVQRHSPGLFTVESRLVLPEGQDETNLSCIIRHPGWVEEKVLPELKTGEFTQRRDMRVGAKEVHSALKKWNRVTSMCSFNENVFVFNFQKGRFFGCKSFLWWYSPFFWLCSYLLHKRNWEC